MNEVYPNIESIKRDYKVKSHKVVGVYYAIRKGGFWLYFKYDDKKNGYMLTGSTLKLDRS